MRLLALPSKSRLERILEYLLDEEEFLSSYGIRSLSKFHEHHPYRFDPQHVQGGGGGGEVHEVAYTPGEATSMMFGGNSNWRGPIWFPTNYLIIEALEKFYYFYGDDFKVEFPRRSGNMLNLLEVSQELSKRLISLFEESDAGTRPYMGESPHPFLTSELQRERLIFPEFFHGDTGRALGASHQTGWTALVALLIEKVARDRWGDDADEQQGLPSLQ
jgi:hypothetical protein